MHNCTIAVYTKRGASKWKTLKIRGKPNFNVNVVAIKAPPPQILH